VTQVEAIVEMLSGTFEPTLVVHAPGTRPLPANSLRALVSQVDPVVERWQMDVGRIASEVIEMHQERLSELREVLDLGGAASAAALYAFDRRRVSTDEEARKTTGEDFNNEVESVLQLEARIAIRLGEDDAVSQISQTYKLTLECFEELRALIFDASAGMTSQQDARADELRSRVVALRSDYLRHARSRATETE
jgi:hypothetical protein